MRATYIYLVTNLVNGKFYVGKSTDPQGRWGDHRKVALGGRDKYPKDFFAIHAAIHKYGIANFQFEIIDELSTEDEAYKAETQWIVLLCSNLKQHGYNCNRGGEGGVTPNEETRTKLIAAQNRPHIKQMKSELMKQRHQSDPRHLGKLQAKLNELQVLEIRAKYQRGEAGYLKLAREYDVGQTTIRKIINRITWRHI